MKPRGEVVAFLQEVQERRYNPWYIYEQLALRNGLEFLASALESHLPLGYDVDPRRWFGRLVDTEPQIPPLLAQVLFENIVRDGKPRTICIIGRAECELPMDWTLPLIKQLVATGVMRVEVNDTIRHHGAGFVCSLEDLD